MQYSKGPIFGQLGPSGWFMCPSDMTPLVFEHFGGISSPRPTFAFLAPSWYLQKALGPFCRKGCFKAHDVGASLLSSFILSLSVHSFLFKFIVTIIGLFKEPALYLFIYHFIFVCWFSILFIFDFRFIFFFFCFLAIISFMAQRPFFFFLNFVFGVIYLRNL